MSRIGKKPILIPEGVTVEIKDGQVLVKGPKGELKENFSYLVEIKKEENKVIVSLKKEEFKSLWGLTRTLIANMIQGVTDGYEKKLQIEGVGYTVAVQGNGLVLKVGFSHLVEVKEVPGIAFKVEKNFITVSGIDKQLVGQVAANIRKVKPPEPYKGKGIRYEGEKVKRKEGKKAMAAE